MRLIVIYNPSALLRNPPPFTQGRLFIAYDNTSHIENDIKYFGGSGPSYDGVVAG